MNIKFGILLFLTLICLQLQAQQKHETYTQKLEGTKLSFEMQAIPDGDFLMGSKNGNADEKPIHKVKLDPFWMSKVEITWDIFEPFLYKDYEVNNTASVSAQVDAVTRPTKPYLDMTFGMGKQNHPALAMTQYNAIQFCKWLYARTGVFYRLPTEAEWEYACKAGNNEDYYFGNDSKKLNEYAWFSANSEKKTHEVGLKKPNAWGLYDMLGNVAEWTYDEYKSDFYASSGQTEVKNPVALADKLYPLVIRGGSYEDDAKALRSAARRASDPVWKQIDPQIPKSNWWFPEAPFIGIRLVRPVNTPTKEEIDAYYNRPPIADY
ncbi:SUMF1/EgtB/PvdO family nonheme iron enzyme [Pedobacter sp. LMG 31464]|uniref:SUMF1/EgtB/PvdO family nonheme iron enzyme n=1 Tax=Pedobacter planticolens TaxID=2679964 RepID=A0A923E1N1_9SPHI|nr:SUMF1/EgtB/PvdO family nonheme iron enzyme [Pedobacter planticolens]MBB2146738.1 SUMF1/EgtB/PvdO family nonheme iron enzyme [Pedobacter planticolens]